MTAGAKRHDDAVFETHLPLVGRRQGKVRDVYALPPGADGAPRLLVVATDRVSAFDVVMPTPIPGKGKLLTEISAAWFAFLRTRGIIEDHLLSAAVPDDAGLSTADHAMLEGRSMTCRAAQVVPIECVARGYLAGSGWAEYRRSGTACGVPLPPGLRQCERLPEPIFTPATKAAEGHDENIDFARMCTLVGESLATRLRALTLAAYRVAAERALERGLILADTKFEFGFALDAHGRPTDRLMLVDEVLTPDSSRYWPADGYEPGRDQPSFDKQYLRDWLLAEEAAGRWDRTPPGPTLPPEVVERTLGKYRDAARMLA
ncbi:MAG: phosphoribosylaminoimidazolesuccinocarboxamide synthase [Actinobacteria bacterium]|nr:phosphoribosylaminoimidazolesuccinocarboxamide synthase [Actinomycetota bacterium]